MLFGPCKSEPTIIPNIITQCLPVAAAACGFAKSDKSQHLYFKDDGRYHYDLGLLDSPIISINRINRVTGKHLFSDLKGWHTAEELTELINAKIKRPMVTSKTMT